jgi:hypothetical protein
MGFCVGHELARRLPITRVIKCCNGKSSMEVQISPAVGLKRHEMGDWTDPCLTLPFFRSARTGLGPLPASPRRSAQGPIHAHEIGRFRCPRQITNLATRGGGPPSPGRFSEP